MTFEVFCRTFFFACYKTNSLYGYNETGIKLLSKCPTHINVSLLLPSPAAHIRPVALEGKGKEFFRAFVGLPLGFPKQLQGTEPDSGVSLSSFNGFI